MRYTPEDLEFDMRYIQDKERDIRRDRGQRYGSDEDTLANIARFGEDGAIVHASECVNRITNRLSKTYDKIAGMFGKEKDLEDLENAVMDLRNYAAYILILCQRSKQ